MSKKKNQVAFKKKLSVYSVTDWERCQAVRRTSKNRVLLKEGILMGVSAQTGGKAVQTVSGSAFRFYPANALG